MKGIETIQAFIDWCKDEGRSPKSIESVFAYQATLEA